MPLGRAQIGVALAATWVAGAPSAYAQSSPTARVEVGIWSAPGRGADTTARVGLDLEREVRLDASWARPVEGPDPGFASGRLELGSWRVAGGVLGEDAALHVGYAPELELDLARWLSLRGEVDAALGAGWIAGREGQRDVGAVEYPPGVDVLTAALHVQLELSWQPWEPLRFEVGAYARGVTAVAPPTEAQPGSLERYARHTDLGLSSALSRAGGGGFGQAELRLWRGGRAARRVELRVRYREAWDWLYLDPIFSLLERSDGLAGYTLEPIPPRVTRGGELILGVRVADLDLELGGELRRVDDSTTARDFADRPGWSLGASLSLSWRRLRLFADGRYHLQDDERSDLLGRSPRFGLSTRAEVRLLGGESASLTLLGGVQVGLPDELGITRDEYAWHAGLGFEFGGPRRVGPPPPAWFPRPSGVRAVSSVEFGLGELPEALGGDAQEHASALAAEAQLTPAQVAGVLDLLPPHALAEDLRGFLDQVELPTVAQVETWIDSHPQELGQVEERFPGLVDGVRQLLRGAPTQAVTAAPVLVSAYGPGGIRLSLVQPRRASLFAVTTRVDGLASELASTRRVRSLASDYAVTQRSGLPDESEIAAASHADLRGLLAAHRLESYSLLEVRRGRARLAFQGDTAWTRGMLYLLTGRSD